MAVRSAVHRRGLRFRVAARLLAELRRTADLVCRPVRVALFIDGCFWPGCPEHYTEPIQNAVYWAAKITGNIERDLDTTPKLKEAGWTVLRFWKHDAVDDIVDSIVATVTSCKALGSS